MTDAPVLAPLDETHDPALRSWVASANARGADFPIQNLPIGRFRRAPGAPARVGVAIGDRIVDVAAAAELLRDFGGDDDPGLAAALEGAARGADTLHPLMAAGPSARGALRRAVSRVLRAGGDDEAGRRDALAPWLTRIEDAKLLLPCEVRDFTDFYASVHHATNVGSMFRPDNPLLPNYKHVPIGYHGRASSLVASGSPVRRPTGQTKAPDAAAPAFGPSRSLDYECELGVLVGPESALGAPIPIAEAPRHVFGFCLVNDWSARDIQAWEYQPLGPFLAKSFATTLGPWIVTPEALAPFRVPAPVRPAGDPAPLPYLDDAADRAAGGLDIVLEVWIQSAAMRERGEAPVRLSRASFTDMYWTVAQLVAHHASNGCNLRPGDLLASGTVSGAARDARGCLLELTWRGAEPVPLPGGEWRRFLQDGDEVILRGHCARDGAVRIGFGECRGMVLPALE